MKTISSSRKDFLISVAAFVTVASILLFFSTGNLRADLPKKGDLPFFAAVTLHESTALDLSAFSEFNNISPKDISVLVLASDHGLPSFTAADLLVEIPADKSKLLLKTSRGELLEELAFPTSFSAWHDAGHYPQHGFVASFVGKKTLLLEVDERYYLENKGNTFWLYFSTTNGSPIGMFSVSIPTERRIERTLSLAASAAAAATPTPEPTLADPECPDGQKKTDCGCIANDSTCCSGGTVCGAGSACCKSAGGCMPSGFVCCGYSLIGKRMPGACPTGHICVSQFPPGRGYCLYQGGGLVMNESFLEQLLTLNVVDDNLC